MSPEQFGKQRILTLWIQLNTKQTKTVVIYCQKHTHTLSNCSTIVGLILFCHVQLINSVGYICSNGKIKNIFFYSLSFSAKVIFKFNISLKITILKHYTEIVKLQNTNIFIVFPPFFPAHDTLRIYESYNLKSALIDAMGNVFLANYNRQTDTLTIRPSDRPTNTRTQGFIGKLNFQ